MTTGTPEPFDAAAEPRSIDLRECWQIVRRRWAVVLALTVIGAIAGAGYAYKSGPTYSATAEVVVTGLTQGPLNQSAQPSLQVNMSTEQAVAQSPPVIARAAATLGVPAGTLQDDAAKRLSVAVPASTLTTSNVLQIAWKANTPATAQAGADAFATAYLFYRHRELAGQVASLGSVLNKQVGQLDKQIARLTSQLTQTSADSSAHQSLTIRLNELTSQLGTADSQLSSLPTYNDSGGSVIGAAQPSSPSGLGHAVVLTVGALLGLLAGLALAFVRDAFDDRVRDPDQLERRLGAPTLAALPPAADPHADGRAGRVPEIVTVQNPESRAAEAVRTLRATLVAVAARRDLRTILIVAVDGNVSSGRLAAELGVALAESGRKVLLVAADMRGSLLPPIFDVPNTAGLSGLLVDGGDPEAHTWQPGHAGGARLPGVIARRMAVLPSGPPMAHALSILDSRTMTELLQSQRDGYEFVVLDSPSATVSADVFAIAGRVDGVIVVARGARTRGRSVAELRRGLDQVGAVLIGGVLIGAGRPGRDRHGPPVAPPPGRPQPSGRPRPDGPQRRGPEPAPAPAPRVNTAPLPAVTDDAEHTAADGAAKRSL